ncbi:GntR family transcriptional regulator [Arthrobacter sp. VKM Ac-2550]|uniref:GntR family transcriptional regulator n=1 Tax=Crystallibacter permensis TaxID=1938888 RepID=UPI002225F454|nr:GntR family transcriptional regulator [Arthrobacter sp. VKM Ac-2550]MCW2130867.1 DNA-binding transcriptional regulator, GntR family [Arthrobacter sp. VKM Ac-2550]
MSAPAEASATPEATTSAASRVAVAIRTQIIEGSLLPGERLPEERVRAELGVSRSTLREGFQLLIRERLMVHRLSRGFFVRELSRSDISDLYAVRRVLECGALRQVTLLPPQTLRDLTHAVSKGQQAAEQADWHMVAAASIGFHEALAALAGSPRLTALARQVLAEFRLSYAYMSDPSSFHAPFLERNVQIAELVRSGDLEGGALALESYLQDSEEALLARYPASKSRTI